MQSLPARAEELAGQLAGLLAEKHYTLALAESCTAGLVSDLLARTSGASAVLWGSYVCYTAQAKQKMLGIDGAFLARHGLVSGETAREMALCALKRAGSAVAGTVIAGSVTGLAGPNGDGSAVPVGTVWVAAAWGGGAALKELHFEGTRAEIRMQAAAAVLEELLSVLLLDK